MTVHFESKNDNGRITLCGGLELSHTRSQNYSRVDCRDCIALVEAPPDNANASALRSLASRLRDPSIQGSELNDVRVRAAACLDAFAAMPIRWGTTKP
jgi:hypothetical protein